MTTHSELIKTLITDPIAVADELWVFKIEILKHSQKAILQRFGGWIVMTLPQLFRA